MFLTQSQDVLKFMLEAVKKLLKYFLILSAILLVIFNWGYIDWFFNYHTIEENLGNLSINTGSAFFDKPVVAITTKPGPSAELRAGYISIAKIGVKAPISADLKTGVLHYPASSMPGDIGTAIILGHSSPTNWPKINYDSVFNNLNALKQGDEVLINFNGKDFYYLVKRTFWVQRGEDLTPHLTFNKSMLLLVSCWPPGKNLQRIVVEAELSTNN